MIINKFGGASIKDGESIKRMVDICRKNIKNGIIVVSAIGKTTNLLERITLNYFNSTSFHDLLSEFTQNHIYIINELFPKSHDIFDKLDKLTDNLAEKLNQPTTVNYDFEYDQIVPYGEMVSSLIVSEYLNHVGVPNIYSDISQSLKTDANYRDAKVDWELSTKLVTGNFNEVQSKVYITQGFIAATINNVSTTLGREGSDFSAAALAYILNAEKVVVWKDVPGVMCADPAWLPNTPKIEQLSYLDAVELAFYGAKVIHPKTIKPLQNKKIPLQVRSFIDTHDEGTLINSFENLSIPPVYIKKENQILVSIKPTDYSFIVEENLSHIFAILAKHKIKVNLMQNSAVSFSIIVDNEMYRVKKGIKELKEYYNVKYNDNLELLTIRHNKAGAEKLILNGKTVLVEQRSRSVARFLVR